MASEDIEFDLESETEPAAAKAGISDEALEADVQVLLSGMERRLAGLGEGHKTPMQELAELAELVHEAHAYAAGLPKADRDATPLHSAIKRALETHPQVRLFEVLGQRLLLQRVTRLYEEWQDDPADRRQLFRHVGRALVRLVGYYLTLLGKHFQGVTLRAQWEKSTSAFVLDLLKAVDRIRF